MSPPRNRNRAALLASLALCSACLNAYPQRWPEPLVVRGSPAAPASTPAATIPAATITVQRDSDPVWLTRPGERGDYALPHYRKRERVPVGCTVRTGAGGRAEILWTPDASAVILFDEGRLWLGDPGRDEPLVRFLSLTHALLTLTPEDRIELLGGARLSGDAGEPCGPVLLEVQRSGIQRVVNQSKKLVTIAFRTELLSLGPGESIDLPVLESGTLPVEPPIGASLLEGAGFALEVQGGVQRLSGGPGIGLQAREPARVRGLGVAVDLGSHETARFSGLTQVVPAVPADPKPQH